MLIFEYQRRTCRNLVEMTRFDLEIHDFRASGDVFFFAIDKRKQMNLQVFVCRPFFTRAGGNGLGIRHLGHHESVVDFVHLPRPRDSERRLISAVIVVQPNERSKV